MATGTVFVSPGRSLGPDVQGHPGSCRRARHEGRHGSLIRISPHFHTSRTTLQSQSGVCATRSVRGGRVIRAFRESIATESPPPG